MDTSNRSLWLVWVIPALALFIALADMPYGYYTLLRLTVTGCAGAIILITYQYRASITSDIAVFAGIALLFNPIIPVHLTREYWTPIDIVVSVIFVGHLVFSFRRSQTGSKYQTGG